MTSDLPQGWAKAPLGTLGQYFNGRAFKPTEWEKKGLPIIRIQNLNDSSAPFNYSSAQYDERVKVRNGDLLIAWSASLGAFIWRGGDAWLNQHIFRVEHNEKLCTKEFLLQAVRYAIRDLYDKAHGTGMVHVTKPVFQAHEVPLPPMSEQQRIVAKLEKLLKKIDDCQTRLTKVPVFLKRFRQSVLAAACSGRLTVDWREEQPNISIVEHLGDESDALPSSWRSVCVGDVIENLKYGTSQKCSYTKRGVPVFRIPNVLNGVIDQTDLKYAQLPPKELEQLRLQVGDILLIRSNGSVSLVGRSALVRKQERGLAYAGYLIRLRPIRSQIESEFLNFALGSFDVRLQIELEARSTSGVNNINSEEVRALRLSLPPLAEQKEIVRRVRGLFTLADTIEAGYKEAQQRVDDLSPSILARAFQGELVQTEAELAKAQGRSFESAEELLERIRRSSRNVTVGRAAKPERLSTETSGKRSSNPKGKRAQLRRSYSKRQPV